MNTMKKVLVVFGTRPEAIKMLPLVKELALHPNAIEFAVCVTAQHREMLDQVLNLFEVIPNFDLNVMRPNQDLFDVTSNILMGMRQVLKSYQPDIVLVHGDTSTTLAVSLAAFYLKIKIGHVEAGLRTYNLSAPWPEEANRQLTDVLSDYYFVPTQVSANNLINEGCNGNQILITGNTVIDALFDVLKKIESSQSLQNALKKQIFDLGFKMIAQRKFVLITGHRRENFGEGFERLTQAIETLAHKYPLVDFVYPVHLNPQVRNIVIKKLSNIDNVYLIEPLDYLPFVYLMNQSHLILTDSGGIQEEAPSLSKPVLVTRETTERPEAVDAGTVKLVGTDSLKIIEEVSILLDDDDLYVSRSHMSNPYGDGLASKRIVDFLIKL